jgi:putative transposase
MKKDSEDLDRNAHSVGEATVHLCWIPWKRRPILKGEIKDRVYEIVSEVALEKGWVIRAITIEVDHMHLFVKHQPNYSIVQVCRAFKGRTSRLIRQEFPYVLKMPSFWARGYCYKTAGKMSSAVIERYINDSHHHG